MRLSAILLVVASFVATLDPAAASDANTVVAATNVHKSIATARFLRARHEDDYPVEDERNEDDSNDDEENDEERMMAYLKEKAIPLAEKAIALEEKATALSAFKKLVTQSGDDLTAAVSGLSKSEFEALFNQGKSHMANLVPGFYPGMSLKAFTAAMKSARLGNRDLEDALEVGYGKYLAYQLT